MKNEDLKDKALEYIEKYCLVWENSDKSLETSNKILETIYSFAHCVQDRCKNPHKDWKEELRKQNWEI